MKKVVAVTLNPCVDYTITVPGLQKGKTNLVKSARKDISGKGINVCMQLKNMEQPVIAAGFDFVDGRVRVKDALEKRGISPYTDQCIWLSAYQYQSTGSGHRHHDRVK